MTVKINLGKMALVFLVLLSGLGFATPIFSEIYPPDTATGIPISPTLSATINDSDSTSLSEVTFYNATDDSIICQYTEGLSGNTTQTCVWTTATDYNTTYSWYVYAVGEIDSNTSENYSFTTRLYNSAPTIIVSVYWDTYNNMICNVTVTDAENNTIYVDSCWKNYQSAPSCLPSGNTTYSVSNNTNTIVGNFSIDNLTFSTKKKCVVKAYDGELESSTTNSATIGEFQPHFNNMILNQSDTYDATCFANYYSNIPNVSVYSKWYKENVYQSGFDSVANISTGGFYLVSTIPYANLTGGDNWTCEIQGYGNWTTYDNQYHYEQYHNSTTLAVTTTTTTSTLPPTPTGDVIAQPYIESIVYLFVMAMVGALFIVFFKQYQK